MGSEPVGVIALALITAGFLIFVAIELGGLALPGWHTVSWLASHYPPLKYALISVVALFDLWLIWHLNQPIEK